MTSNRRRKKREVYTGPPTASVLCVCCHKWFQQYRSVLDTAYWNECDECSRAESAKVRRALVERGITCLEPVSN